MARRRDQIATIDQAIAAYGGIASMEREFSRVRNRQAPVVHSWLEVGEVPRGHHLPLLLGLLHVRGQDAIIEQIERTISPKLFGVPRWSELPGWPRARKLPKRASRKR